MEPKIRYNGYTNKWDDVCLNDIVSTAGIKNRENLPLVSFSITNDQGFVPQDDKFENGGTMRDANKSMYYIVSPKTFAYNPARINVGSIGYYDLEKDVIISSLYVVFKTDQEKCDDYYFLQWFKSDKFKRLIEQYQEGGVRLYFFYDKLCKCHVHIPSKEEQHKISSYFRVLDFKLQASAKKLESLKKLKSASLVAMFPQNGESMPKVRFKGFEGEWIIKSFKELYKRSSIKNDLTYDSSKIISVANMYFKEDNMNTDEAYLLTYNVMKLGDIAFEGNKSKSFAHGRFVENSIGNGIVSHVFVVFSPLNEDYDINFWKYYINNEQVMGSKLVRCTKSSTMMTDLVVDDFLKETILVPSLEEQQEVGRYFATLDRKIALETARLEKLKQIKLACLDKMFV